MSAALSSWKEIAAYLGKGVRTVQRWERQFGLPVRRPSAKSHVIFALQQELDAWIKQQQRAPVYKADTHNAVATAKKRRQEQAALLGRLNMTFGRLEAAEQELDQNIRRLMAGFRQSAERLRVAVSSKRERVNQADSLPRAKDTAA